jgi:AraC family transcriptional regulator
MALVTREHKKPAMPSVLLNPRGSAELGTRNAILSGSSCHYHVPECEGWLSIKSVLAGSVTWEAAGRKFVLHENTFLILNDRQRYSMTMDSTQIATTFCLFFERGFVEDVYRGLFRPDEVLLDAPQPGRIAPLGFYEKIESKPGPLFAKIKAIRRKFLSADPANHELEDDFFALARAMVRENQQEELTRARLPASRATTREELYKRLLRGRDCLLSSQSRRVRLQEASRAACLSPFHFHRSFTQLFGETPHVYLTRHRLERAAHLLKQSSLSVTEICLETGFESLGSFSSLFRRRFGSSPREFRITRAKK